MFRLYSTFFVSTAILYGCSENSFTPLGEDQKGNGPQIEVSPDSLNFGTVTSDGTPVVQSFQVKNIGHSDLDVDSIQISGDDAISFTLFESFVPFLLPPGATKDIQVMFFPQDSMDQMSEAFISSNDEVDPTVSVSLYGFGAVPELSVIPNPLDMGTTFVGCNTTNELILSNIGSDDLQIYAFEHSGGVFQLTNIPALPVTIPPGGFTTVGLSYTPLFDEQTEGLLTIVSNDPNGNGVSFASQLGTGAYIDEHIQTWENPIDPPSDILFSVDLSCSMDDDAAMLGSNFQSFINELSNYSNDWQIMVANNDNGCNNSGILTPSTSGYQSIFANSVGCCEGADTERLLTIASRAIDQTDPSECNANFIRSNAMLHVIMVSDEPEQSYSSWSSLVDQIIAKKGDANNVRLSAIAGLYPYSSCAAPGTGYWDAVNATGGVYLDICTNWSNPSNLELLAEASVISASYPLDYTPAPVTIEVFVNGLAQIGTWHYDSSTNAVVFDSSPPEEGDFIMITYGEIAICD